MMHGNISNHVSATFGFMCEDFVLLYREGGITDRVLNFIVGKNRRVEVNKDAVSIMEHLYRNTEYTVDLIIHEDNYEDFKPIIDNLPFSRVVCYNRYSQITARLNVGDLTYVVDGNDERRGLLNSEYAIHPSAVHSIIRKGG